MAVEAALRRAVSLWGRLRPSDYPNGIVVFCSKEVAEAVHPLQPLQRRLYSCARSFDTAVLRDQLQLETAPPYGIIVIDGSDAMIGTARGVGMAASGGTVTKLLHLQSNTASSTRRGGQSALRYSRLRDEEDLAFRRRVAERAVVLLSGARAVVVGGKAETKQRLLAELPAPLRRKVLCTVTIGRSADAEALRLAASLASEAADQDRRSEAAEAVRSFVEATQKPDLDAGALCCYGERQTRVALEMGAVASLLIAAEWHGTSLTKKEWKALAAEHGTQFTEVSERSEADVHFCKAFAIGARLRWPVDPELLEGEEAVPSASACTEKQPTAPAIAPACSSCAWGGPGAPDMPESLEPSKAWSSREQGGALSSWEELAEPSQSEVPSEHSSALTCQDDMYTWLQGALGAALGDTATAEALVACTEVILQDESVGGTEAWSQAIEMLLDQGAPQDVIDGLMAYSP